jgi:DnaK suppressor protein
MNAEKLDKIKKNLQEVQLRLLRQVNSELNAVSSAIGADEVEVDDDLNMQLAQLNGNGLKSIDEALIRIKSGSYGICEGCEKEIPFARLEVLPWTTRCLKCQTRVESRQRFDSDDSDHWKKVKDEDSEE